MYLLEKKNIIENGVIDASKKMVKESFLPHRHDFFEIEYIISGTGKYMVNGREYEISAGKVFFMTPADFHAVYTEDTELINIMFSGGLVECESLFSLMLGTSERQTLPLGRDAELLLLLALEIVDSAEKRRYEHIADFLSCFLHKLADLSRCADEPILCIKKAVLYILENFTEHITLEGTARYIGLSKNYLSELFHDEVGVGFKEYVDELRFVYVARLLMYSEMSVGESYLKSGFSDYANFSRRFKQKYGMPPTEYRRSHKKAALDF